MHGALGRTFALSGKRKRPSASCGSCASWPSAATCRRSSSRRSTSPWAQRRPGIPLAGQGLPGSGVRADGAQGGPPVRPLEGRPEVRRAGARDRPGQAAGPPGVTVSTPLRGVPCRRRGHYHRAASPWSSIRPLAADPRPRPAESSAPTHVRWVPILAMVAVGTMINYLDRTVLGMAAPFMTRDLGLTAAQLGLVFSAFSWSYALLQIPGGIFLDRFGTRRHLLRRGDRVVAVHRPHGRPRGRCKG